MIWLFIDGMIVFVLVWGLFSEARNLTDTTSISYHTKRYSSFSAAPSPFFGGQVLFYTSATTFSSLGSNLKKDCPL